MLLNDTEIKALAEQGMIEPFVPEKIRRVELENMTKTSHDIETRKFKKVLSYGLGHYGYDLTLSPKDFREFVEVPGKVMDPKNFDDETFLKRKELASVGGDPLITLEERCKADAPFYCWNYFVLSARTCGLGFAVERLKIPPDITVLFIGKSTYARLGIVPHVTPAEAGWEGHLTMEISNTSPNDCKIYANEGIVQALFFKGNPCATPYGDGKYQNQEAGVTLARI